MPLLSSGSSVRRTLVASVLVAGLVSGGCSVAYEATLAANSGLAGAGGAVVPAGGSAGAGLSGRGGAAGQAGGGGGGNAAGGGGVGGGGVGGAAGAAGAAGSAAGAGGTSGQTDTKCPGGTADECNDGNPCTVDRCTEGVCVASPVVPGTVCDTDTDKCNGVGVCAGASCDIDATTVVKVADLDNCTDDLCDPATGIVTHAPKVKPGESTVCTLVTCDPKTGERVKKERAFDNNECTFDECSLDAGPLNIPKPTGDGDPCTQDGCDPLSGVFHKLIDGCGGCTDDSQCADENPCTADSCGTDQKCRHELLDGTVCDNGTVCDGVGVCKKGVCDKGVPVSVDDANPCTQDSCDPKTGVKHTPIDTDDNNACTIDACNPGAEPSTAVSHVLVTLPDGDPCTTDSCDPLVGLLHVPIPGCQACTNVGDCPNGSCLASLCNPGAEGGVCSTGNLQQGTPCGDGLVCNGSEACDGKGACAPGQPPTIDDGNSCTTDGCIEPGGPFHTPTAACKACSTASDCDMPNNICLLRDCVGGKCTTKSAPTGTSCGNGTKCDGSETCEAGVCKPGSAPNCGIATCSGTKFVSPVCSETSPTGNGCGTVTEDCAAQNKVCSVASSGCVACDNGANKCEAGKVCNLSTPAPHLCCTPDAKATTCAGRVCGTVTDNCGQVVSCGSCATSPKLTCAADQLSCVCTPEAPATTCGSKICGTAVNNCGTLVSCGSCVTAPKLTCAADQRSCL